MALIDNSLFTQTNPSGSSLRTDHAEQHTALNNETNSVEDTLVQGYVRESATVTYVSASSFTVSGDVTAIYTASRIVRFSDGTTGIVSSSSYSSPNTTINIVSGTVPSTLSYVDIAIQPKGGTNQIVDVGTAQTITGVKTFSAAPVMSAGIASWDGWMPANETWTYASATSFTVSGDVTAKYPKGTKIRLTQTTPKYFYVIGTSYASPNTTVTITGGSDYTLANAAVTDNRYSYASTPQGFPDWFNWTPTYSCSGSMTYTSVTTNVAKFKVIGSACFVEFGARGTTGGTADIYIMISPPIIPVNLSFTIGGGAVIYDGGAMAGCWHAQNSTQINFYKYNSSSWSLGPTKDIKANFFYSI